ncbi:MAG: DnaA regulatory inactivator Hda [Granulosicoccus sp.]|nr:DnaA regulatory inactivator Hda [Granulosicoccus sp.]
MTVHPQLPLALDTAPARSFTSFHVDQENTVVRDALQAFLANKLDDTQIYLWGHEGAGKSHLLSAACEQLSASGYRIAFLPGELVNAEGSLEAMDRYDLLCIDDLQRMDHAAEIDLFHCVNRCRDANTKLIFAADRAPDELGVRLPDLKTRLSFGLVFHIRPLSERGLQSALRREIQLRSLSASDEVIAYVLRRFPRRISLLKQVVDELDQVSLSEQRRITIPLVKQVFGEAQRVALNELGQLQTDLSDAWTK